jgi:protein-glutamine gamma-glutamyltransferase
MIRRDSTVGIEPVLNIATFLIAILVFLTVSVYIGPAHFGVFLLLFFAASWCEWRRRFLPRMVLTLVAFGVIGLWVWRTNLSDLAPQTVETLLLLLAVKLLEQKQFRDYMQIFAIAVFLLAGSALLGINLIFLSYVVVLAFLFNAAMVLVAYHRQDPLMMLSLGTIEKILRKSALIPLCAIPLGAVIFVITPRTPFPLLDFLNQGNHSTTGFSDQVRLGRVSDIQESESIIFRAAMKRVPEEDLYWRGIVMDHFDGATWRSVRRQDVQARGVWVGRHIEPIEQEIYLEPYENSYLFALDRPSRLLFRSAKEYGDGTFSAGEIITRKVRYRVTSLVHAAWPDAPAEADRYLQLPDRLSAPIKELSYRLRSDRGPAQTLGAIQRFLNGKDFSYSLANLPVSPRPLEEFLFDRKIGNCEYFASAFAVLARINGIPARLVAGYQGGFYNDLSGYYLVSQKQAHVWVEAFLPGRGWVRYDPTPAAGPQGRSIRPTLLARARLYLDAINYYWVAFVVNYDVQKQLTLFMNTRAVMSTGGSRVGEIPVKKPLIFLVCAGCLFYGALRVRRWMRQSRAERLTRLLLKALAKRGYVRKASQGLEEFVATIEESRLKGLAAQIVEGFEETYYRDKPFSKDEMRRLMALIKRLPDS